MYAKVEITGILEVKTGLHIKGNSAFAAIGAVDSPVYRDPLSGDPMIPGSSLKGKIRSLLAKQYNETVAALADDDADCLTDLFGSAKPKNVKFSRVLFSDLPLVNKAELRKMGADHTTEVKFENKISRSTAVATPRQIERVIRGAEFSMSLLYEMKDEETMIADFKILRDGFRLLEYDYLGGNGSRGYGKVGFKQLDLEPVIGEISDETINRCREILREA